MALDVSELAALVARGERHAVKVWLAGLPALVHIAHIGSLPPPLLPLPASLRPSPDPALGSSTASDRWGVVPGLETEGGGRGGVRSPAPACVRRGAVRRSPAPSRLVGGAIPWRDGGGLLPCGHGLV